VTAIVIAGLLQNGRPVTDPMVAKGLKYLESFVQPSGGIHTPGSRWGNYETCVNVVAFQEANKDGRYKEILAKADKYLKSTQFDEAGGHEKSSIAYGGAGYSPGTKGRPDLSNTHYLVEALSATGNDAKSEAMQKALVFISRCQNLESEHNTTPLAAKINDGGFFYTPVTGEGKKAPDGGLPSYGSMTYAGFKSMIFAGLSKDDKRVKAATDWIGKNYDLKTNPGKGPAGLYYYYQVMAKALDAAKLDQITDAEGKAHNWRQELLAELAARQQANGSWVNESDRWMEGDAHLVTGFALQALAKCRAK
jgi:squalene-hopene/tetraprenyl-beta-curcumene cyclase